MESIDLADYLFKRLYQLGIRAIHGVPGDYNLAALDYIEPAGLRWIGNCNELNAGYAADGYARIKGLGVVVTAFGVGELSAINAIAGAEAEKAPVVHIVGTPPTAAQRSGKCMHHSLGDGDFDVFAQMYEKVTVAQANLTDPHTAGENIDAVLRTCKLQSRPVYIRLPLDMVKAKIDGSRLHTSIDLSPPPNDEGFEDAEVETILSKIYQARNPAIVVDGFVRAYDIREEVDQLVKILNLPTFTTPFGKSLVSENIANFHGIYDGLSASPELKQYVQTFDIVLRFGPLFSDVNTCGFTSTFPHASSIDFHQESVHFGCPSVASSPSGEESETDTASESYHNLHVKSLLHKLLDKLDRNLIPKPHPQPATVTTTSPPSLSPLSPMAPTSPLLHKDFWPRLSTLLRPNDVIMTETGTASLGGRELVLPPHVTMINSSLWLSIGYMFAAAQGVALAKEEEEMMMTEARDAPKQETPAAAIPTSHARSDARTRTRGRERGGRTILLTGDGSFQVSCQELGTIIRHRIPNLVIFLINNDGYTIERFIHGMKASYNDVGRWRYGRAGGFFGADEEGEGEGENGGYRVRTREVRCWGEMVEVMREVGGAETETEAECESESESESDTGLWLIEVHMEREDAPESLKRLVGGVKKQTMEQDQDQAAVEIQEEKEIELTMETETETETEATKPSTSTSTSTSLPARQTTLTPRVEADTQCHHQPQPRTQPHTQDGDSTPPAQANHSSASAPSSSHPTPLADPLAVPTSSASSHPQVTVPDTSASPTLDLLLQSRVASAVGG